MFDQFRRQTCDLRSAAALVVATQVALTAEAASAYVGPGAGITAIGTVLALFGALLLAVVGFVWYPVKRLVKRRKSPAVDERVAEQTQDAAPTETSMKTSIKPGAER